MIWSVVGWPSSAVRGVYQARRDTGWLKVDGASVAARRGATVAPQHRVPVSMADKTARCPASADTIATLRPSLQPVNSGRRVHHRCAAGIFNGYVRPRSSSTLRCLLSLSVGPPTTLRASLRYSPLCPGPLRLSFHPGSCLSRFQHSHPLFLLFFSRSIVLSAPVFTPTLPALLASFAGCLGPL